MADNKLVTLILNLRKRTNEGKVQWDRTTVDDVFSVSFPNYSIEISREPTRNYQEGDDMVLRIYNNNGNIVEEIRDVDVTSEDFLPNAYSVMSEIYSAARRQAMGVDVAINTLLAALEEKPDDDDIPF